MHSVPALQKSIANHKAIDFCNIHIIYTRVSKPRDQDTAGQQHALQAVTKRVYQEHDSGGAARAVR
jgi:hypothetical protein